MALQNLFEDNPILLSGIIEFDETFLLDRYKEAPVPKGAGHKVRKHSEKATKRGIPNEYIAICIGIQRDCDVISATVNRAKPSSRELGKIFWGHIVEGALILTDSLRSAAITFSKPLQPAQL